VFLAYNLLLIGERKMDFMSYHLMKMQELKEYRQARKKADVLAVINTFVLLLICGLVIWLKFKFMGGQLWVY
jgi:hypothetical protein